MKEKIIYYENEMAEDFSGIHRKQIAINQSYKYERSRLWRFMAYILYVMVRALGFFYMKLFFSIKFVNRRALKLHKRDGYFLYGNHTHIPADGFLPALLCYPKHVKVIVCSENLSLKGTKNIMAMLGAIPIPNKFSGMRNFKEHIHHIITKKHSIAIYPEAHVWPYYSKIRPFPDTSFTYPVLEQVPVYSFTVTYHKKGFRTRMICYVDGPFYPDTRLTPSEASLKLRNRVYDAMVKRSKNNSYEKIKYIKREII